MIPHLAILTPPIVKNATIHVSHVSIYYTVQNGFRMCENDTVILYGVQNWLPMCHISTRSKPYKFIVNVSYFHSSHTLPILFVHVSVLARLILYQF